MALSRAKSEYGEGRDPDFAFHEDRFKPANTPTTRAREVEMEMLYALASQCQQRETLAPAYWDGTFLRMVESQGYH